MVEVLHSYHRCTTVIGGFVARLTRCPLVVAIHEFKTNWAGLSELGWSTWCTMVRLGDRLIRVIRWRWLLQ